jgi:hypothetical protein
MSSTCPSVEAMTLMTAMYFKDDADDYNGEAKRHEEHSKSITTVHEKYIALTFAYCS